jgi:hypothetical protein
MTMTTDKKYPVITLDSVESSQIHVIGHDGATNTLAIQFKTKNGIGSVYHYANFTAEQFEEFKAAESIGSYFKCVIRPSADAHPYVKINTDEHQS